MRKSKNTIVTIEKPIKIKFNKGENVLLEKGDKIEVLNEDIFDDMNSRVWKAREELIDALTDINDHSAVLLITAILDGDIKHAQEAFDRWVKREKQGYL